MTASVRNALGEIAGIGGNRWTSWFLAGRACESLDACGVAGCHLDGEELIR
jgi:hypothetical protein